MNFDLTDQQKENKKELAHPLKQTFQDFFPETPRDPRVQGDSIQTFLKKIESLGFYLQTGINPGQSRDVPYAEALSWVLFAEELALMSPSICLAIEMSTRLFGWIVSAYGDEKQIQEFFFPLQKGVLLGAVAMAESSGSFPEMENKTEAQKEGGGYKVTGRKKQVINAPVADYLAVTGIIKGQQAVFLIKSDQPGLNIGDPLKPLGFQNLTMADVTLNQCLVSEDQVIGPFNDPEIFRRIQTRANLIITVASIGVMARALQGAKIYAGESREGGKPAQAYQVIRFKLAEMFALFQTSQWMLYRAAWMLETMAPDAETTAAAAKVFITEAAEEVAKGAMQILAGDGYLIGNGVEECFRDARFGPVAGETSEALRMRIADDCLAKYR